MTCWPLLLLPRACAVPHRPLSSIHHRAVPRPRVAVAPSISIAPRRPSPSTHHCAVHRCPSPLSLCSQSIAAALAPSLAVEEPSRAVLCCQGSVALSLTVEEPSCPPLPSRSCRAVHCRRGAVAPYLIIKEPSAVLTDNSGYSSCPSKPHVWLVVTLPLLMPPPPICRRLSLRPLPFVPLVCPADYPVSLLLTPPPPICWRLRLSSRRHLLLSRPSRASRPAG